MEKEYIDYIKNIQRDMRKDLDLLIKMVLDFYLTSNLIEMEDKLKVINWYNKE